MHQKSKPQIELKIFNDKDMQFAAALALKNRLYVSGWDLSHALKAVRRGEYIFCNAISILFDDSVPVGVAISQYKSHDLMVFVRKSKRRKGYGSLLANSVKTSDSTMQGGMKHSYLFFDAIGVKYST